MSGCSADFGPRLSPLDIERDAVEETTDVVTYPDINIAETLEISTEDVYNPDAYDGQSIDTFEEISVPSHCFPTDGNLDPIFTNKIFLENMKYNAWNRRYPQDQNYYPINSKVVHLSVEDIPYITNLNFVFDPQVSQCPEGDVGIPCESTPDYDLSQYNCEPCPYPRSSDINGVECLSALKVFAIGNEPVTDLSNICNLKDISSLALDHMMLSGYDFLGCLPNLEITYFQFSNVMNKDLEPLQYASKLQEVDLRNTNITDLTPFILNDDFKNGDNVIVVGLDIPCEQILKLRAKGVLVTTNQSDCM